MFRTSLYLGIAALILMALLLGACAKSTSETPTATPRPPDKVEVEPIVGGPCDYDVISGMATIVSVRDADPAANNCDDAVEVVFDFVPDEPGDVDRYRFPDWSDKGQYLTVGAGMNPPRAWVEDQGIVEGSTQRCMRLEITKGTCTPVIFSFPEIDFSGWADAPSGQITPEIPASTLLNREWVLESFGPIGAESALLPDTDIDIRFGEDNQVTGSAGCNRYFGGYEVKGKELSIPGPLGTTRMACPDPIMDQEGKYLQALQKVAQFEIDQKRLKLFYDDGQGVLNYTLKKAAPAKALLDREWVLESYGEPGNLQTVSEDAEITIEFKSDEPRFGGSAGCNRYFGGYEMEDDELSTTGPIGSTEMWCEGKMEQEDQYLQALQKVSMFIIEENRLQLFYDDGKSVLNFTLKEAETAKGLTDREWVLESIGEGQTMQSLLKDTEITIEFTSDEARFGGSAGCNRYFGGYAVEGNNLSVPGPVGSTMMACPEPIMDQEQQYLSTLEGAETFEIEDGTLTIFSSANRLLVFSER